MSNIRRIKQEADAPVLGSNVASLRTLINAFFASREVGFILKFPPTKNWRGILSLFDVLESEMWWEVGVLGRKRNGD